MGALRWAFLILMMGGAGAQAAPVPSILTAGNNTDLGTYATTDAPNGLQRCGYLAPGDSPCLGMQPSSTACAATAFSGTVTTAVVPTTTLNVTVASSGSLRPGLVMPAGGIFTAGTIITRQLTGTLGGVGTYELSQPFNPPPTFTLNVKGDGTTQVPTRDGKCWLANVPTAGVDIRQFGVVFDGITDNSAAMQAAFTWWQSGNQVLLLPGAAANANFSTPIVATFGSQVIGGMVQGAGRDASTLAYTGTSGNAITVNYNSVSGKQNSTRWRDFTLCTNQAGGPTGIKLSETAATSGQVAASDFSHVTFRGCDGYGVTDFWSVALNISGPSEFTFLDLTIDGGAIGGGASTGVLFHPGTLFGFQYNFVSVNFNNLQTGIQADANVQGLTISGGSNFVGMATALNVTSGTGTFQFTVADSQFNCQVASQNCFIFAGAGNIIRHNLILLSANNVTGINFGATSGNLVQGNLYENLVAATGTTGEIINNAETIPNAIIGNTYVNLNSSRQYPTAGQNYPDIVKGNVYSNVTTARPAVGAGTTTLSDVPMPFSTVSPCTAALTGYTQAISDDLAALAWRTTVTGAGTNQVVGNCNGTNWTQMGG